MKRWQYLIFALFLAVGLIGCGEQAAPPQLEEEEAPVPQTETYTDEHSFFTAEYPAGWVVQPYLFGDEAPFPHVAFGSHQEIMDLSMVYEPLPEDQIGVGVMILPRDMFAEAGVTAETPLDEVAQMVLMGLADNPAEAAEMLAEATFESSTLSDGTPAVYATASIPTEAYAMTLADLGDGLYLFTSQILAVDYHNAELEAQVEAIVNSVELTASSEEVMEFIISKMSMMEEMEEMADGPAAPTVTFTATEYAYDGPESIPAGLTRLELVNAGEQEHMLWTIKLDEGRGLEDIMAFMGAMESNPQIPDWLEFYGGVTAAAGDTMAYTIDLPTGNYLLVSFSSGEDEIPDIINGMTAMLTVTEARPGEAVPPTADLRTEMVDFSYIIEGTPDAGPQVVEVTNTGMEPHEIFLFKLEGEAGVQDAVEFLMAEDAESAPPFAPYGGVGPMTSGLTAWYEFEFQSGEYGLVCFVSSADQEGAPHFMLGMTQQISVP